MRPQGSETSVQRSVQSTPAAPPPYSLPPGYAPQSTAPQSTQIPTAPAQPAPAPAAQPAAQQPLVARPVDAYNQQGSSGARDPAPYSQSQYNQRPYAQPGTSQMAQPATAQIQFAQPGAQAQPYPGQQYPGQPMYPVTYGSPVFYRRTDFTKYVCAFFLGFGLFLLVLGIVLMSIAGTQKSDAEGLNVDADFTRLGGQCQIKSVEHCWETEVERQSGSRYRYVCRDTYVYTFDAPSIGGTNLLSRTEVVKRGDSDCSVGCAFPGFASSGPPTGRYDVGESVDCWEKSRDDISGFYRCGEGNTRCVKIFDPEEDVESAVSNASALLWSGVGVFVMAFVACLVCCIFQWWFMRRAKAMRPNTTLRR